MAELWYLKKFSCLMQGHEELTSANFRFYNFIVTNHDAWTAAFSIQFLLIQSGEYNIFQAIGYEIGFDVLFEGISLKCKHWDFFTELPKVLIYWDTKDKKSKVTVRDPE